MVGLTEKSRAIQKNKADHKGPPYIIPRGDYIMS